MKVEVLLNCGAHLSLSKNSSELQDYIDFIFERLSGRNEAQWLDHATDCSVAIEGKNISLILHQAGYIQYVTDSSCLYLAVLEEPVGKKIFNDFIQSEGDITSKYSWSSKLNNALKTEMFFNPSDDLRKAASLGDNDSIKAFLASGCNINEQDPVEGFTALHCAVLDEKIESIKLLLANGADVSIKDNDGDTPYDCCSSSYYRNLLDINSNP
jgi:hypothetical protein